MYLHPLIAHLPQHERDNLKKVVDVVSYKRNDCLLAYGQKSSSILCVATGLLRVALFGRGIHEEVTTDFVRPDEFFLPASLRDDEFETQATVLAALPTTVYSIPIAYIRVLCTTYPTLLIGLLEHESRRIEQLRTQLQHATTSSAEERVGRVLSMLTQLAPTPNGGYDKRITQAVIASHSAVTREAVNKAMKGLERRGLVTREAHGIRVLRRGGGTDVCGVPSH